MAAADTINSTIGSKLKASKSGCAAMKTTSNCRLLREACASVKPQWKVRVQFTRVRATGETELVRVLLRGADLLAAIANAATPEAELEVGQAVDGLVAGDVDFAPSDLQRKILLELADGPQTTGQLANALDVTTARLFDRGKVLHQLVDLGLVGKQSRGYALTAKGKAFVEAMGEE